MVASVRMRMLHKKTTRRKSEKGVFLIALRIKNEKAMILKKKPVNCRQRKAVITYLRDID
ncbi:MAG: hypothetical protein CR972_05010 [Candidatus Moraniibacteriota bacterium]|nr:MAG: hypothetical protein CR972_05010 [Candidatus Moranbacteria bacterium]